MLFASVTCQALVAIGLVAPYDRLGNHRLDKSILNYIEICLQRFG